MVGAVVLAVAGCGGGQILPDNNEGGFFSKPLNVFATPDWARPVSGERVQLGPSGPVAPEDLITADGQCPAAAAMAAGPAQVAATPASVNPLEPGMQPHMGGGGIALGMSECEAVRRAGQPSNVSVGADEKGERKVVLTYLAGNAPGIYTFASGRLKVVERAPEPQRPSRPPARQKR
ncbi:MAG: hypothetical protein Q8M26_04175 [Pseudolabrys sp.]|nr:hypothetical protein [Pseudolabrys sp.]